MPRRLITPKNDWGLQLRLAHFLGPNAALTEIPWVPALFACEDDEASKEAVSCSNSAGLTMVCDMTQSDEARFATLSAEPILKGSPTGLRKRPVGLRMGSRNTCVLGRCGSNRTEPRTGLRRHTLSGVCCVKVAPLSLPHRMRASGPGHYSNIGRTLHRERGAQAEDDHDAV